MLKGMSVEEWLKYTEKEETFRGIRSVVCETVKSGKYHKHSVCKLTDEDGNTETVEVKKVRGTIPESGEVDFKNAYCTVLDIGVLVCIERNAYDRYEGFPIVDLTSKYDIETEEDIDANVAKVSFSRDTCEFVAEDGTIIKEKPKVGYIFVEPRSMKLKFKDATCSYNEYFQRLSCVDRGQSEDDVRFTSLLD